MTDADLTRIAVSHGFCRTAPTTQEMGLLRAVAEAQREECAQLCDDCKDEALNLEHGKLMSLGCVACASAIRSPPAPRGRD